MSLKILSVEHLKVLMVEHLKVMAALSVEPACAFNLLLFFFDLFEGQISN